MGTSSDRLTALRAMSAPALASLLGRVPALGRSLHGEGSLAAPWGLGSPAIGADVSLAHLAVLLASPRGVATVVDSLTLLERQLLTLAALHDGAIDRHVAVGEAGDARALDDAVDALAGLLLAFPAHEQDRWLVLRPGVARYAPFDGVRVYDALRSLSPSDLGLLLDRLGAETVPPLHEQRRRLVGHLLRTPHVAQGLRDLLDVDARAVLDVLVHHGGQRVADLGLPPFDPWDRRGGPLHACVQAGLVGVDLHQQIAYAWLDLRYGLRERLFDDWPLHPPRVDALPLHDPGPGIPRIVTQLRQLLDRWSAEPLPKLAAGGVGVRPVRATAKAFGMTEGAVGTLVHLAIDLALLGETEDDRWAPSAEAATFTHRDPAEQWAAVVAAWRESVTIDEKSSLPNRWTGEEHWPPPGPSRNAVLDVLLTLPDDSGVEEDVFVRLCAWRYPDALGPAGADEMLAVLRLLSLVPADGPVGLTPLARALLREGAGAVTALTGGVTEKVIVQADHTVIAPPNLAPAVAARLGEIAVLESDAGAQVWRLTPHKVATAMAEGRTRDEIVAFLTKASSVPPAPNVLVTVDDVAERHGRLRAGTIGSYLRCEDPVDIVSAAAVGAAKLRVLSPTVAVSPLSRDALIAALRARDLLAVAEDGDGTLIPPRRMLGVPLTATGVPALATQPPPDPYDLAKTLLG